ncbi:hypothetical protein B0H11DRAFT_2292111 [Mycena galericulata]|nr:hypothetical protein B0H11DRAFT_2292111 [Mycena galericulata]
MSQTVAQSPLASNKKILDPTMQVFPPAWLVCADERYVIDPAHWNKDRGPPDAPGKAQFSVDWNNFFGTNLLVRTTYGVEIIGLIVRHYFGVAGCIIPVGCLPGADEDVLVFTTAGPCDADGRKEFYILFRDSGLETSHLLCYTTGFRSLADFHLNRFGMKQTKVVPVAGGEEVVMKRFVECGYHEEPVPEVEIEWSLDDWAASA